MLNDQPVTDTSKKVRTVIKALSAHYRGVKKYETPYTGYLYCGDCKAPMFNRSHPDLDPLLITLTQSEKRLEFSAEFFAACRNNRLKSRIEKSPTVTLELWGF